MHRVPSMEQNPAILTELSSPAALASTSPSLQSQQEIPSQPLPSAPAPIFSTSTSTNPNSDTKPSAPRPPFSRAWSHQSHIPNFPSNIQSPLSASVPPSTISSIPLTSSQKGGMAIGVPAKQNPTPTPPPPASFSSLSGSSFGQQFVGLGRNAVNASEAVGMTPARQTIHGMQGAGMQEFSSSSQVRLSGISSHNQQRSVLSSQLNSATPSLVSQNLRGHNVMKASAGGSSSSLPPCTSQALQSQNQPWLSSEPQGKPPLPPPTHRRTITAQLQQRSHITQQSHQPLGASQQNQMLSGQKSIESLSSQVPIEQFGQQFQPSKVPQFSSQQAMAMRGQGPGIGKNSPLGTVQQPNMVQAGPMNRTFNKEIGEDGVRILGKRSIHEIVSQVDPSERLDPEVEEILVDIAEDFVDSITTFGCSLAKHRKSNTLEAKDILLHLERNWNMSLPGFSGDEIKINKKPAVNDLHRERIAAIKKSIIGTEVTITKNSSGHVTANAKGQLQRHQVKF